MKKILLVVGALVLAVLAYMAYVFSTTKSHSPEANVEFSDGNLKVHVFYNRPFKKGRDIFGGLVPFGQVWRTGANEASYVETNQPLMFGDQQLKPGKYSLWTIPGEKSWTIIFNSQYPSWGVSFDGVANYDEKFDALRVEAPVRLLDDMEIEQFTISVEKVDEGMEMIFQWDKTLVAVPFKN